MGWPQITLIVLMALGTGIAIAQHGRSREPLEAQYVLLRYTVLAVILYAGGFWS